MEYRLLTHNALVQALHLRDLTDPLQGPHAMQQLVTSMHEALAKRWRCYRQIHRMTPLMTIDDNYNRLAYPVDGAARDARYTRYVTERTLLRTHMSALIPGLLRALALDPPDDLLLVCPGLVYRRDCIDRLHTGEPHQLELWRITRGLRNQEDLLEMIDLVLTAALPDYSYRTVSTIHPYTIGGLQVDVEVDGVWIEVGECGVAAPDVLSQAGLDTREIGGLAMGLGLDRLLMIRKQIDDIRLLRSDDPRIARQMLDLQPYTPVSHQPPIRRDLSIAVEEDLTPEELGDRIREVLLDRLRMLESVEILSETRYEHLPTAARDRMGMHPEQKNVLLRLVIRDPVRTLTSEEANELRNLVYRAIHQGTRLELAYS